MQAIKDGEYTKTVYTMIKDERYSDAIKLLNMTPEAGTTRAGLSLLGYCCYMEQDFVGAADCYEHLLEIAPEKLEYKFYYAQSLFQAGLYEEAYKVSQQLESDEFADRVCRLQGAVRYAQEDYTGAQAALGGRIPSDPDTLNDEGCLLYQAERYTDALGRFTEALQAGGYKATVAYNAALCNYKMRDNTAAINYISEIVERGIRAHPELAIGAQADPDGAPKCIGNPPSLQRSGLAQALNLRAAIEYREGNLEGANEAMMDLPPRSEPELDPVTLHNLAVTKGGPEGLRRLSYLLALGAPACPQQSLSNLLLICCKHELFDAAADALADHADLTYRYLSPFLYELIDALICSQTAPGEAAMKLEAMSSNLTTRLRSLTAKVEDARHKGDQTLLRLTVRDYEETLSKYLPVAAAQAWLPWRRRDWAAAEQEFRTSAEFCAEAPEWKLLAAHVLFMAGDRYKEAAALYEPLVRSRLEVDILSVSAGVLANLCVAYIMTSQNEAAEELMRKIEREEERKGLDADGRPQLHLCIVNLVIGTLYCSKGNYEFGLSRISRALEGSAGTSTIGGLGSAGDAPPGVGERTLASGERLCADTWLHAKRCVLALCAGLAKQSLVLPSAAQKETLLFLENCEAYGKRISSVLIGSSQNWANEELSPADLARKTVAYEARILRCLLIKLQYN